MVRIIKFIKNDEYNTDSLCYDVEDACHNSNIYKVLNHSKHHLNIINKYHNLHLVELPLNIGHLLQQHIHHHILNNQNTRHSNNSV